MALDEKLRLPDLLAPLPGDDPVGPDLKYSNDFHEIELAHHQGLQAIPPTRPPGGPGAEAEEAFGRVVETAGELLLTQSKDLRVATYLTAALLRVGAGPNDAPQAARSFAGLAFGFDLLRGMLEAFWDTMHPGLDSRKASLASLASPDLTYPVRQVPLTRWGHGHSHYREWITGGEPARTPDDPDTLWSGNFEAALEETEREYYMALHEELERCTAALESLEDLGRERFAEADESPPSYGDLKKALRDMESAASQLLERKSEEVAAGAEPETEAASQEPATEDPAAATTESTDGAAAPIPDTPADSPAPAAVATPSPGPSPEASDPQDAAQAAAAVASAARVLRTEDATDPVPYLLLRGLRWGEVRRAGDRIVPQMLESPGPEERKRLRGLFLEEEWSDLLEAAEEVMATEAGRGWLDLQRYAILAADHLGQGFGGVAAALRGALRSLLEDLPALATATLMDDSAAASPDTRQWLQAAGFIASEEDGEAAEQRSDDTDPGKLRREASYARAHQMVQAGDPDGAIQLLMGRADRENSERASFITRGEAAGIMVERGEASVARPILNELLGEIDEHNLEQWEAGDVVARPLGLLFRCLDTTEGPLRQQVYERICRLDPILARKIGNSGHGE